MRATAERFVGEYRDSDMKIQGLECTSDLCRVEFSSGGSNDPANAIASLRSAMSWPGENYIHTVPGDQPQVILYAARPDRPLPRPEAM